MYNKKLYQLKEISERVEWASEQLRNKSIEFSELFFNYKGLRIIDETKDEMDSLMIELRRISLSLLSIDEYTKNFLFPEEKKE